ncbi:MAG: signal peptide peptidase SppA [Candidatus Woesearchaeota archaeon]
MEKRKKPKWTGVIVLLIVCSIVLLTITAVKFSPTPLDKNNKIAVIDIKGPITLGSNGASSGLFSTDTIDSGAIISFVEIANQDKGVKGIILNINSPGGTVVASKEIVDAVKKVDKPVVALIREVGASGAYWIASAADVIVADPLSITGSIGVAGGYLEFSDLISEYGVEYRSLKSGKYKDLGNQWIDLTPEGKNLLQKKLDIIHNYFINDVNKNRGKDLTKYATGLFYLGTEAKEIGLIDELGGKDEAIAKVKELAGLKEHQLVFFKTKKSIFDILGQLSTNMGYSVGQGLGSELVSNPEFEIKLE